jgi:high-affinity iron transporter
MLRRSFMLLALALAVAAVGCGGSDEGGAGAATEAEESTSAEEAVGEIEEIERMLDEALASYRAGNTEEAEEIVGDAYLEHFEQVEHPLEELDHDLMEELEVLISTTLRDEIRAGASASEVEALVEQAKVGLAAAKSLLQES